MNETWISAHWYKVYGLGFGAEYCPWISDSLYYVHHNVHVKVYLGPLLLLVNFHIWPKTVYKLSPGKHPMNLYQQ